MDSSHINKSSTVLLHPGAVLRAELKRRGMTQKEAAGLLGLSTSHLSELLNGKRPVSLQVASLAKSLWGMSDVELLSLQNQFNLSTCKYVADDEAGAIAQLDGYNEVVDIKVIAKRLKREYERPFAELLAFIKKELPLELPPEQMERHYNGLFRRSDKTGQDRRMILSWSLLARYCVKEVRPSGTYSKERMGDLVRTLRPILHENNDTISRVSDTLSQYGIKFAICEKLDKCSVDGFSFVQQGVPCIVLTNRIRYIDSFSFNVMHELGHVYAHLNINNEADARISVQERLEDGDDEDRRSTEEMYADTFARQALIDKNIWRTAPSVPINPFVIQSKFTKWAKEKKLNPWIVLGRISRETGMYKFKKDDSRNIN